MEKPIIQIRNLGKEFKTANGPVRALNDINLDINQGEIFGIIGLSGAGKSTLVRCINYLEAPTEGEDERGRASQGKTVHGHDLPAV